MPPLFDPGPIEHPDIPVHLAAVNTHMCRVAGEVADGTWARRAGAQVEPARSRPGVGKNARAHCAPIPSAQPSRSPTSCSLR
jgi:hypothetical protein